MGGILKPVLTFYILNYLYETDLILVMLPNRKTRKTQTMISVWMATHKLLLNAFYQDNDHWWSW